MLQPKNSSVIVFDALNAGHRENYVKTLSWILNADGIIGPPLRHLKALVGCRILVFSSFETKPGAFALCAALRSLLGKKTVLLLLRAPIKGATNPQLKKIVHRSLAALPGVRLLTILPLRESPHLKGRAYEIQDPEFWDLDSDKKTPCQTDLSEQVVNSAKGRKIILCAGGISGDKGMLFLSEMMKSPYWPAEDYLVCSIGQVSSDAVEAVDAIEELGGLVFNRYVTDIELVSAFQCAQFSWCCYPPERDMSSGVFGRSCQFECWPLVRSDSILEKISAFHEIGTGLPWSNADEAAKILAQVEPREFFFNARREENIERFRSIAFDPAPSFNDVLGLV